MEEPPGEPNQVENEEKSVESSIQAIQEDERNNYHKKLNANYNELSIMLKRTDELLDIKQYVRQMNDVIKDEIFYDLGSFSVILKQKIDLFCEQIKDKLKASYTIVKDKHIDLSDKIQALKKSIEDKNSSIYQIDFQENLNDYNVFLADVESKMTELEMDLKSLSLYPNLRQSLDTRCLFNALDMLKLNLFEQIDSNNNMYEVKLSDIEEKLGNCLIGIQKDAKFECVVVSKLSEYGIFWIQIYNRQTSHVIDELNKFIRTKRINDNTWRTYAEQNKTPYIGERCFCFEKRTRKWMRALVDTHDLNENLCKIRFLDTGYLESNVSLDNIIQWRDFDLSHSIQFQSIQCALIDFNMEDSKKFSYLTKYYWTDNIFNHRYKCHVKDKTDSTYSCSNSDCWLVDLYEVDEATEKGDSSEHLKTINEIVIEKNAENLLNSSTTSFASQDIRLTESNSLNIVHVKASVTYFSEDLSKIEGSGENVEGTLDIQDTQQRQFHLTTTDNTDGDLNNEHEKTSDDHSDNIVVKSSMSNERAPILEHQQNITTHVDHGDERTEEIAEEGDVVSSEIVVEKKKKKKANSHKRQHNSTSAISDTNVFQYPDVRRLHSDSSNMPIKVKWPLCNQTQPKPLSSQSSPHSPKVYHPSQPLYTPGSMNKLKEQQQDNVNIEAGDQKVEQPIEQEQRKPSISADQAPARTTQQTSQHSLQLQQQPQQLIQQQSQQIQLLQQQHQIQQQLEQIQQQSQKMHQQPHQMHQQLQQPGQNRPHYSQNKNKPNQFENQSLNRPNDHFIQPRQPQYQQPYQSHSYQNQQQTYNSPKTPNKSPLSNNKKNNNNYRNTCKTDSNQPWQKRDDGDDNGDRDNNNNNPNQKRNNGPHYHRLNHTTNNTNDRSNNQQSRGGNKTNGKFTSRFTNESYIVEYGNDDEDDQNSSAYNEVFIDEPEAQKTDDEYEEEDSDDEDEVIVVNDFQLMRIENEQFYHTINNLNKIDEADEDYQLMGVINKGVSNIADNNNENNDTLLDTSDMIDMNKYEDGDDANESFASCADDLDDALPLPPPPPLALVTQKNPEPAQVMNKKSTKQFTIAVFVDSFEDYSYSKSSEDDSESNKKDTTDRQTFKCDHKSGCKLDCALNYLSKSEEKNIEDHSCVIDELSLQKSTENKKLLIKDQTIEIKRVVDDHKAINTDIQEDHVDDDIETYNKRFARDEYALRFINRIPVNKSKIHTSFTTSDLHINQQDKVTSNAQEWRQYVSQYPTIDLAVLTSSSLSKTHNTSSGTTLNNLSSLAGTTSDSLFNSNFIITPINEDRETITESSSTTLELELPITINEPFPLPPPEFLTYSQIQDEDRNKSPPSPPLPPPPPSQPSVSRNSSPEQKTSQMTSTATVFLKTQNSTNTNSTIKIKSHPPPPPPRNPNITLQSASVRNGFLPIQIRSNLVNQQNIIPVNELDTIVTKSHLEETQTIEQEPEFESDDQGSEFEKINQIPPPIEFSENITNSSHKERTISRLNAFLTSLKQQQQQQQQQNSVHNYTTTTSSNFNDIRNSFEMRSLAEAERVQNEYTRVSLLDRLNQSCPISSNTDQIIPQQETTQIELTNTKSNSYTTTYTESCHKTLKLDRVFDINPMRLYNNSRFKCRIHDKIDENGQGWLEVIYPCDEEVKFHELFKLLNLRSNLGMPPQYLYIGKFVSALYKYQWQRAVIIDDVIQNGSLVKVRYLDTGRIKFVDRYNDLREVDEKFFNAPSKALNFSIRLDDTVKLNLDMRKFFSCISFKKTLNAKIINLSKENYRDVWMVELICEVPNGYINMFPYLLSKYNHAAYERFNRTRKMAQMSTDIISTSSSSLCAYDSESELYSDSNEKCLNAIYSTDAHRLDTLNEEMNSFETNVDDYNENIKCITTSFNDLRQTEVDCDDGLNENDGRLYIEDVKPDEVKCDMINKDVNVIEHFKSLNNTRNSNQVTSDNESSIQAKCCFKWPMNCCKNIQAERTKHQRISTGNTSKHEDMYSQVRVIRR